MRKFGRDKSERSHLLRNLATSLILYEEIETTYAKGKELIPFVDRLIATGKAGDLTATRYLMENLFDKNAVRKIVKEFGARYKARTSGFVKSYRLKNRVGDNASMIKLVLIDKKTFVEPETVTKIDTKKVKADKSDTKVTIREKKNGK